MATTFIWKGRSPNGEILAGEYVTDNKTELINYLRKRKIIITSLKQKSKQMNINLPWSGKITVKDLGVFTRQFATMINAGLPMVQCLDILANQLEKERFKKVVGTVTSDVEGGSTLAEALGKHDKVFSNLYVNMVEAGEAGGILDQILLRLAVYLELQSQYGGKLIDPIHITVERFSPGDGYCTQDCIPPIKKDLRGVQPFPIYTDALIQFFAPYWQSQVLRWRRSYDIPPPGGESLKDTAARVIPYYQEHIWPRLSRGKSILVVAHGNSLRALVMHLDQLSKEEVLELNIPTGAPLLYELDDTGKAISHRYL